MRQHFTNNFGRCPKCNRLVTLTLEDKIIDHMLDRVSSCKGGGLVPAPLDPPLPVGWRLQHDDIIGSWRYVCPHGVHAHSPLDRTSCDACIAGEPAPRKKRRVKTRKSTVS